LRPPSAPPRSLSSFARNLGCGHAGLLEAVCDLRILEKAEQQLVDGQVGVAALFLGGLRAADGLDERRGRRHGVRRR
jgi:hypothetical protein